MTDPNTPSDPPKTPMKGFVILWGGQAISLLGSQLAQFALIWWLTEETGSGTILATASLVGLLPQVILGPVIGALVDRWPRRLILFSADATIALFSLLLAGMFWVGVAETWHIFAILFIRALGGAFHYPAMAATTTLMVPKDQLTRVQGFNQMLQGGLNIVAAPLAAVLLIWLAVGGILLIDVITALFAILPLFFVLIPEAIQARSDESSSPVRAVWNDMMGGFRYVRSQSGILILMGMAMLINFLLTPAVALMPLYVTDYFNGGAVEFGMIQSATGLGILAGGIVLGVWGGFKKRIYTMIVGLVWMGIFIFSFSQVPPTWFYVALVLFFLATAAMPLANGSIQAIMQVQVPPELQGRVFTLLGTLAMAMSPLGLVIAGPAADILGVRFWFALGGVLCATSGIMMLFLPAIMNLEREPLTAESTAVP